MCHPGFVALPRPIKLQQIAEEGMVLLDEAWDMDHGFCTGNSEERAGCSDRV